MAGGVPIAVERVGEGPPVVCVHGSNTTRRTWRPLRRHLADRTVVTYDRRGRGDSGDGDDYALDREVADLAAVIDACETPPHLFGHSFGGVVALEAARDASLSRLTCYEPPVPTARYRDLLADVLDDVAAHLAAGDERAALWTFLRAAGGLAAVDREFVGGVESLRPGDPGVETVYREVSAVRDYRLPPVPVVDAPVALLRGTESPWYMQDAVALVADALDADVTALPGVGHLGHQTDPAAVAAALS